MSHEGHGPLIAPLQRLLPATVHGYDQTGLIALMGFVDSKSSTLHVQGYMPGQQLTPQQMQMMQQRQLLLAQHQQAQQLLQHQQAQGLGFTREDLARVLNTLPASQVIRHIAILALHA